MSFTKSFLNQQDDFKKAFALSVFIHLFLALFFAIKVSFFSKPLIDISQAISVNVEDFKLGNTLPQKKESEPAIIEKEFEKEVAPEKETVPEQEISKPDPLPKKQPIKEKDTINLAKNKIKQKQALDKLKKMSALDKIKQELKNSAKSQSKRPTKSRVVAAGSEMTGLDKIEAASYLQSLDASIKQYWTLPQWLANKNFRAQVLVKFDTSGQILSTKLLTSSGNSTYDNYCIQAITKAAPFPRVPNKFSQKFSVDGLIVGFPE